MRRRMWQRSYQDMNFLKGNKRKNCKNKSERGNKNSLNHPQKEKAKRKRSIDVQKDKKNTLLPPANLTRLHMNGTLRQTPLLPLYMTPRLPAQPWRETRSRMLLPILPKPPLWNPPQPSHTPTGQ